MVKFHCNCCGCDFTEEEGARRHNQSPEFYDEITCPNCEASYDEEETYVERYSE